MNRARVLGLIVLSGVIPREHAVSQTPSPWTLQGAASEAVLRSPEVRRARREWEAALLEEPLLLANTDPSWVASYRFEDDQAPRSAPFFQGSRARRESSEAGITAKTLLGSEAGLKLKNDRLTNPSVTRSIDPSVDSRLALEIRQPLLRYFWGRPDIARRSRARAAAAASQARLRNAMISAVSRAARAAVELHAAQAALVLQSTAVSDAERLLAKHQDKRRYGLVEDSDVIQAEAALESRRSEAEVARSRLENARFSFLASLHRLSEPESAPPAAAPPEVLPEPSPEAGLSRRADIEALRAEASSAEWAERIERLDTLPELSLSASYAAAGLSRSYGSALDDMGGFRHSVKSAGMNLSVPFGFKRERLSRRLASLRLEAVKAELEKTEESARREERHAKEALRLARVRVAASERLAAIERRKLKAEEERHRQGRTTTDLLIRFSQDIRRAEEDLLRARAEETLALLDLASAAGTLLEVFPVEGFR